MPCVFLATNALHIVCSLTSTSRSSTLLPWYAWPEQLSLHPRPSAGFESSTPMCLTINSACLGFASYTLPPLSERMMRFRTLTCWRSSFIWAQYLGLDLVLGLELRLHLYGISLAPPSWRNRPHEPPVARSIHVVWDLYVCHSSHLSVLGLEEPAHQYVSRQRNTHISNCTSHFFNQFDRDCQTTSISTIPNNL